MFGTFARFAPTEARDGRLLLRPPGAGLLDDSPSVDVDDGLRAAAARDRALRRADRHRRMGGAGKRAALALPGSGDTQRMVIRTVGLVAFWGLFLGAYLGICAVMSWVASGRLRRSRSRAASP